MRLFLGWKSELYLQDVCTFLCVCVCVLHFKEKLFKKTLQENAPGLSKGFAWTLAHFPQSLGWPCLVWGACHRGNKICTAVTALLGDRARLLHVIEDTAEAGVHQSRCGPALIANFQTLIWKPTVQAIRADSGCIWNTGFFFFNQKLIIHDHWGNVLVHFFQWLTFKCPITKFYHFHSLFAITPVGRREFRSQGECRIWGWNLIRNRNYKTSKPINKCSRATLKSIAQTLRPKSDFIKFMGRKSTISLGGLGATWPFRFCLALNVYEYVHLKTMFRPLHPLMGSISQMLYLKKKKKRQGKDEAHVK